MFKRNPAAPPPYPGPPTFTTTVGHVERPAPRAGNPTTTEDLTRQFDFKPGRRIVASDRDYVVTEDGALRRLTSERGRKKKAKRRIRRALVEAQRLNAEADRMLAEIRQEVAHG